MLGELEREGVLVAVEEGELLLCNVDVMKEVLVDDKAAAEPYELAGVVGVDGLGEELLHLGDAHGEHHLHSADIHNLGVIAVGKHICHCVGMQHYKLVPVLNIDFPHY